MIGVYIRVSTYEQNEESQKREIARWLGDQDARWFDDKQTGDNLDRPGFDSLQRAIFMHEIDTVVCYKLDRISRSLKDGINTLSDWLNRGVRLVAVSQQFDFSGPVGRLVASLLFGVAEMEQSTRRERQAAGIAVARANGVYKGRKCGSTKIDAKRARSLHARGLSDSEIATMLGVCRRTVIRYRK